MENLDLKIMNVCDELKQVMKVWDETIHNRNANLLQIGALQLRIDGLCRDLDKLNTQSKKQVA